MVIRLATAQDKGKLFNIFDQFAAFLKASDVPSVVGKELFDSTIIRDEVKMFVAEDNDQFVGYVILFLLPILRHGSHYGHIEEFFVNQDYRHKGVGTQLFDAVKKYCLEHSVTVIRLNSGNDLIDAHKFYEKNGGKTTEKFFRFDLK